MQQERERLLQQVKADNQEIASMQKSWVNYAYLNQLKFCPLANTYDYWQAKQAYLVIWMQDFRIFICCDLQPHCTCTVLFYAILNTCENTRKIKLLASLAKNACTPLVCSVHWKNTIASINWPMSTVPYPDGGSCVGRERWRRRWHCCKRSCTEWRGSWRKAWRRGATNTPNSAPKNKWSLVHYVITDVYLYSTSLCITTP